jgi:hypothetical protein
MGRNEMKTGEKLTFNFLQQETSSEAKARNT